MRTIESVFKRQAKNAKVGKLNIINDFTGSGKTFAISTAISDYCIRELGAVLIVISQPRLSIWSDKDKQRLKDLGLTEYKNFQEVAQNLVWIEKNKGFIVTTPNIIGEYVDSQQCDLFKKTIDYLGDRVVVFIDEIHVNSVSNEFNYKACKGRSSSKYNKYNFYKKGLSNISKSVKYFWGFTATAHAENKALLPIELKIDYVDVTPPREHRMNYSKPTEVILSKDPYRAMSSNISNMLNFNSSSDDCKKIAMFQCRSRNSNQHTLADVRKNVCSIIPSQFRNERSIIVDTSESTYSISPKEILEKKYDFQYEKEIIDQEEVYRRLESPDSPEQFLFCVEKYQLGSNLKTLSQIYSFRDFNYENGDQIILEKLNQLHGRAVRPNLHPDYFEEYARSLHKLYTHNLEEGELEEILDLNSCKLHLIKNPYTTYFKEEWHSKIAVSLEFVREYLEKLK